MLFCDVMPIIGCNYSKFNWKYNFFSVTACDPWECDKHLDRGELFQCVQVWQLFSYHIWSEDVFWRRLQVFFCTQWPTASVETAVSGHRSTGPRSGSSSLWTQIYSRLGPPPFRSQLLPPPYSPWRTKACSTIQHRSLPLKPTHPHPSLWHRAAPSYRPHRRLLRSPLRGGAKNCVFASVFQRRLHWQVL